MTPQAMLRARFSELADTLALTLTARRQGGNFYLTITGEWKDRQKFIKDTFAEAWITSAAGPEVSYRLPPTEVERVLSTLHVDPAWLQHNNSAPLQVARAIRADTSFDLLPILADALEEAGCDNTEILSHCREGASHQHTCWVIELLLGPERQRRGAAPK